MPDAAVESAPDTADSTPVVAAAVIVAVRSAVVGAVAVAGAAKAIDRADFTRMGGWDMQRRDRRQGGDPRSGAPHRVTGQLGIHLHTSVDFSLATLEATRMPLGSYRSDTSSVARNALVRLMVVPCCPKSAGRASLVLIRESVNGGE